MQNLYRRSALLTVIVCTFWGCGPFGPFDPNAIPPPDYDSDNNWVCRPDQVDSCDNVPLNSGLTDNQETAEADCFAVHGSTYAIGPTWNADPQRGDDEQLPFVSASGSAQRSFSAFNGTCRIYVPRYRIAHGWALFNNYDGFAEARAVAYEDVERAFDYYLANENEGRPFFLVGHSQGSFHLEDLVRNRIEGTALADGLVAAYLVSGLLSPDSPPGIPYCNDPLQTGCVVGWNTVALGYTPGVQPMSIIDMFHRHHADPPRHCTNPLSWTEGGGHVPASQNPGSVSWLFFEMSEPGLVGGSCREYDPDDPIGGVLEADPPLNGLQDIKYNILPTEGDYHGSDFGLFYMSIRNNAQDRLDSYLQ